MTTSTKLLLPLLALSLAAPLTSSAQTYSCPGGATPIVVPGFGTYCPANESSAPEIGASASVGGTTLLLCGFAMLRRKRKHTEA